jgi:hypothetical protein
MLSMPPKNIKIASAAQIAQVIKLVTILVDLLLLKHAFLPHISLSEDKRLFAI